MVLPRTLNERQRDELSYHRKGVSLVHAVSVFTQLMKTEAVTGRSVGHSHNKCRITGMGKV